MQGKIIKGIGGFYYVNVDGVIYECKARGKFRNQKLKPAVGDNVIIDEIDNDKLLGNIVDILPRTNNLIRPAVANVDQAVIIFALAKPDPNFNLLDRFLITMELQEVKTIICFNKCDLVSDETASELKGIYEACGYQVVITSTKDNEYESGINTLKNLLLNKTTVFAGPSGVGKSSMLNRLFKEASAKTGDLSEKIERGKHTTRHSELMEIEKDTYIMDTPGFTSLYVENVEDNELRDYFPEFSEFQQSCKFNGCIHINEPGCEVKNALTAGKISKLRYENYKQIYEELKSKRRW